MGILISLALVAIGMAVVYFRFRDSFSDLAAATDSKQSSGFWTIIAVIYAVVVAVLFLVFYRQGFARWW
jgi:uncharacterized membrane protein YidH (DUF202 family)